MSLWKLIKLFSSNYYVYCLKCLIEINDSYQLQHNYKTCATDDSNTYEYFNIQFHF